MAENTYVYRSLYDFNGDDSLDQISMREGDVIEVSISTLAPDADFRNPKVWLTGFNRTTHNTGLVPGNFLRFVVEITKHKFSSLGISRPVMCNLCQDYIWGSKTAAMKCEDIVQNNNKSCSRETKKLVVDVVTSPQSIRDWSNKHVIEWMATVNLYNYIESFKRQKIDGATLIGLDEDKLKSLGIEDNFHRQSVMICVNELCGREQVTAEVDEPEECTSDATEHELSEHTFTSIQRCHKCSKYLYGVIRQGLLCKVCGLCLHRQCRQGKVPACGRGRLPYRRRASFTSEPLFGIDLESQFLASKDRTVPDVLLVCTEEIERRVSNGTIEWDAFYRTPVSTESISELKKALDESGDPFNVNLSNYKSQVIGGIVKKYLRELSNPLIPVEYYDRFIEAAQIEESEVRSRSIVNLVNELPEHHNSALKYMMTHLYQLVHGSNSIHDCRRRLSQVFCHILLRPHWDDIMDMVHNTQYHLRIFEHLFTNTAKDFVPDLKEASSGSAFHQKPPVPNHESMQDNLDQCEWFWGDVSKEEVHDQLNGTPDGTFLVRRATTHAVKGDYTLTLRKGSKNRLIKIYHKNGKYGFSEPYEFSSVQELVEHFTHHSLSEYNRELNCTLDYPVINQMQPDNPVDDSVIFNELQLMHQEYQDQTTAYESLLEKQSKTTQDIQMLYQAHDSFKELVKVFEEQLALHRANHRSGLNHDYSKIQQNCTVLESRLRDITNSKNRLEETIKKKSADNRQLIAQINSKKPEIKSLSKKCEQLRSMLLNKGHDKKHIDEFLESSQRREGDYEGQSDYASIGSIHSQNAYMNPTVSIPIVEPTRPIPHRDQNTWYRDGVDRSKARDVLKGRPEGTFLIRPKGPTEYALSIIDETGQDVHCIIYKGPDGYGFADPFKIHETLIDLVLHYRETSLAEHNPTLNCRLMHPAYLPPDS